MISLPYKGKQGENVIHSLRNNLDKVLPQDVQAKFVYTGTKFSAKFQINDKTKDEHKHDLVSYAKCPECNESYVGETGRRLQDRVDEHSRKGSKSNILRHCYLDNHKNVSKNSFKIHENGYKKTKFKRKLSEALYIKEPIETFYLNFSGRFGAFSDVCVGVFEKIDLRLRFFVSFD